MKRRAKGNRHRRKCIERLEKLGYQVDVVEKTGRFCKQKDMFGLFDLIAIKPLNTMFIQVASQSSQHPHGPLIEFADKYKNITVRQYVWVDRKGFKIFNYKNGMVAKL